MADFGDFVSELDRGQVYHQLSEALEKVVDAVETYGTDAEKGKIVLELTFSKEGSTCVVNPKLKVTVPREPLHGSLFYFDGAGGLKREDPRQLKLARLHEQAVKEEDDGR